MSSFLFVWDIVKIKRILIRYQYRTIESEVQNYIFHKIELIVENHSISKCLLSQSHLTLCYFSYPYGIRATASITIFYLHEFLELFRIIKRGVELRSLKLKWKSIYVTICRNIDSDF